MREIKFRGKDIAGEWHYGLLAVLPENVRMLQKGHYISNEAGLAFAYQVIPETVGQFIGLPDRNDKEIYEGDIAEGEHATYLVLWDKKKSQFNVKIIKTKSVLIRNATFPIWQYVEEDGKCRFEVIGNIHDNHEFREVTP